MIHACERDIVSALYVKDRQPKKASDISTNSLIGQAGLVWKARRWAINEGLFVRGTSRYADLLTRLHAAYTWLSKRALRVM